MLLDLAEALSEAIRGHVGGWLVLVDPDVRQFERTYQQVYDALAMPSVFDKLLLVLGEKVIDLTV